MIGQGANDIKFLSMFGIGTEACYIIDTTKAAQNPLGLSSICSVATLLDTFQIPYANLHSAGNDAYFTLKAMLMIAVVDAEILNESNTAIITTLRSIWQAKHPPARAKLPGNMLPEGSESKRSIRQKRRIERRERKRLRKEARDANNDSARDEE